MAYVCLLMLYLVIVLFPKITALSDELSLLTPHNSLPATYDSQPVILWQNNTHPSVETVHKIAQELFHEDADEKLSLCIVALNEPSPAMDMYLATPRKGSLT